MGIAWFHSPSPSTSPNKPKFPQKEEKEGFRLRPDSKTKWVRIFGHEFSFLTELFPNQVFHLCHMSSSANVAAPLLPGGCCWSQFWPGLFPHLPVTAGARAGQAGTQTTQICSAHSSSYPCLAPPVLSCHIQSWAQSNLCPKFTIVSLRLTFRITD